MTSPRSTISIRVVPGAKNTAIELLADGSWKIRLRARAVEGQANNALLRQVADWLDLPKSHLQLLRGQTARLKVLEISGLEADEIARRLRSVAGSS